MTATGPHLPVGGGGYTGTTRGPAITLDALRAHVLALANATPSPGSVDHDATPP